MQMSDIAFLDEKYFLEFHHFTEGFAPLESRRNFSCFSTSFYPVQNIFRLFFFGGNQVYLPY